MTETVGGGLLGGLETIKLNCNEETLVENIDKVLASDSMYNIPVEYEKYCNWDERGFAFLTHWTIFLPELNELVWVSVIENPSQNEKVTSISIRGRFDQRTKAWVYAKDIDSLLGGSLTNMFKIHFLENIDCEMR